MQEITKEDRKAYNRHVRHHDKEVAAANAVAPFLIIIILGTGIWMWQFSPFIAKALFLFAGAIAIGRMFSGAHINDPHRDIKHNSHDHH